MANRRYTSQYHYSFHKKIVHLTCKFQVLATAGSGVSVVTSTGPGTFGGANPALASFGEGIQQVLGYSSSPATGNNTIQGNLAIQLSDNYKSFMGMSATLAGPVTGSSVNLTTGLTLGQIYQIVTIGTSTTANWQTAGVPAGVTPVVGLAFQAATASAGTGTGTVKAIASSQVTSIEVASDPNYTLAPVGQSNGFNGAAGGWIFMSYFKTTTLQQPTDGTNVWIRLFLGGQ